VARVTETVWDAAGEGTPVRMDDPASSRSTTPIVSDSSLTIDRVLRYVALGVMAVLVGLGLSGAAGIRSRTTSAAGDDLELSVRYGQVVRPGLAAPFEIAIRAVDGRDLPAELRVEVTSSYLAMFDENGLEPEPLDAWSGDGRTVWTYSVPAGERELTISLDARIEPGVQLSRREADISVRTDAGHTVALDVTSWVLP